ASSSKRRASRRTVREVERSAARRTCAQAARSVAGAVRRSKGRREGEIWSAAEAIGQSAQRLRNTTSPAKAQRGEPPTPPNRGPNVWPLIAPRRAPALGDRARTFEAPGRDASRGPEGPSSPCPGEERAPLRLHTPARRGAQGRPM